MAPERYQTAWCYEEPLAVQFSIFLANRVGQFKELLDLLVAQGIRLAGVSVVDSTDWAVIRMIVSEPDKARELLGAKRLPHTESEVLLVELDSRHSLSQVCTRLLQAEINLHFAYPLLVRPNDRPVIAMHVDDTVLATRTLIMHGTTLLGHADLAGPESV